MIKKITLAVVGLVLFCVAFNWTFNYTWVAPGQSMMLQYKGPILFGSRELAEPGKFAVDGQIGVYERLLGPGRHFYCPIWWEKTIVEDVLVLPGEVGIVRSKVGEDLPRGEYLVDGNLGENRHKGILRKAFTPGLYRANPYAYEFTKITTNNDSATGQPKVSGWVSIPTGYVGVVTNLTSNPITGAKAGIQDKVLPPGLYPTNGKEQQIDIIGVGYSETTVVVDKKKQEGQVILDGAGEPVLANVGSGINFPSSDGFNINLDFTAIWGIMPDAAPSIIKTFGTIQALEQKVILPQIESIARNHGSQYSAVDLLIGDKRQEFQDETSDAFDAVLNEQKVDLLYGLVRHIYIPSEVRLPIQKAFIANELQLTRVQEQKTAIEEGELREAEQNVLLESETIESETNKLKAEREALGNKKAAEILAEGKKKVAAIDKEVAILEAEAKVLLGQAEANGKKLQEEARAEKFTLAVKAFGTPEAYNNWMFATGLPDTVDIQLIYAGPGTFWTDLKGFTETVAAKNLVESRPFNPPQP